MSKRRTFTRVGSMDAPRGILYGATDLDGVMDMSMDMERELLLKFGFRIDAAINQMLRERRNERGARLVAFFDAVGVTEQLRRLLAAAKKRDAEKLISAMTLTRQEFVGLIRNAPDHGWSHRREVYHFEPEHLRPSEVEYAALFSNGPGPLQPQAKQAVSKIQQMFRDRLHRIVHIFERGDGEWHVFYLSYEDAFDVQHVPVNHWQHGTHLHYVSHLWGPPKEAVLARLTQRNARVASAHIRFRQTPEHLKLGA
jgi:hypothetical protein